MTTSVSLTPLYQFPGWVIKRISLSKSIVQVNLRLDKRRTLRCPDCNRKLGKMREVQQQVLDLPMGPANYVVIIYPAIMCRCSSCGTVHTIKPQGISPHAKCTDRLKRYVSKLCQFMAASRVSEFIPISKNTAIRWDKEVLMNDLPEPNLSDIKAILVDEKSIGKGHEYLTVVINAFSGEVLHIAEGKRKKSLEGFFAKLSSEQKASIQAAGIDRSGAYKAVIKKEIPKAEIVYDKFHLIANYNEVIDKIRREEWRKAKESDKKYIKGQRYNLFRNPENLKQSQKESLDRLLKMNENLNKAYVLKDALKVLWTYRYEKCADTYLKQWVKWAKETGISILQKFANGLYRAKDGIIAFCKHRITSAKIESFNAKIDRIIRRACGYRDLEYLYLKIRQEAQKNVQT